MKNFYLTTLSIIMLFSCEVRQELPLKSSSKKQFEIEKEQLPELGFQENYYVPAYSNLFYMKESQKTMFTVVLSIRNISFQDTVYFIKADYYGSSGQLLRSYIKTPLMLGPMESTEFIVEQEEREGGVGANFVVSWGASSEVRNKPLIESVMIGTISHHGFAFKSEAIQILD